MKIPAIFISALLGAPIHARAVDAVQVDIYVAGELKQSVSLAGYRSFVSFSPVGIPNTTLELRLVAPEPVIFDLKETTTEGAGGEVVERIKLPTPGSSFAVSEIKGARFHNAYVLVRPD